MWNEDNKKKWLTDRRNRRNVDVKALLNGILAQDITALSRALTLVESENSVDTIFAQQLIQAILPHTGKAIRIGITGVPGVGKSTFIEAFGLELINQNKKIAVLAIDPSSERSKGSILGDKTRMNKLSVAKNAFVRPTASNGSLGGVARRTKESILLCEAFGFDVILIETVGVGQSETMVRELVDFFLLLMLAGAGDELQGIKRGIMEMADALVITKADGENVNLAKLARREYQNAMHLFPPHENGWISKSMICSAFEKKGITEIWETILSFQNLVINNGFLVENRKKQELYWFNESSKELLLNHFHQNPEIKSYLEIAKKKILDNESNAFTEAQYIVQLYINQFKK